MNLKYKNLYIVLTVCLIIFLHASNHFACERTVVTLSWAPPTTNSDGTPLTDLAGYIVYYYRAIYDHYSVIDDYAHSIDVGDVRTYQISNLIKGDTYYFAITAYDTSGNESEYSNVVGKTLID